jgi:adenylyltransferase/sulfurtransferase
MNDIGLEGQKKLKAAKVLMIGAGGLGSPAALYLSGAGIGTLGLVDADHVDESNLHRQVIHTEDRLGMSKVESAKFALSKFNRHTVVHTFNVRLTPENASSIIGGDWDLVMDGSDNAATRYLINDACVVHKKPLVSGSALQWEGQITVLNFLDGPCYRCLYPKPPPAAAVTNCSDGGVVGMVPGLIGQMQALEIVKIIIGQSKENILWRRMIFLDALAMKFRNVKLRERNPKCVACGPECPEDQKIKSVESIDYEEFCQTKCNKYAMIKLPAANTISVEKFYEEIQNSSGKKYALIDVRPKVQY